MSVSHSEVLHVMLIDNFTIDEIIVCNHGYVPSLRDDRVRRQSEPARTARDIFQTCPPAHLWSAVYKEWIFIMGQVDEAAFSRTFIRYWAE